MTVRTRRPGAPRSICTRSSGGSPGGATPSTWSRAAGAAPHAELDGIRVYRTGGRHTFALRGRAAVRARLAAGGYDVLVEDLNKIPLYLAGMTSLPLSVLVHHL